MTDDEGYEDDGEYEEAEYEEEAPEAQAGPAPAPERRETVIPIGEAVTPDTLHGVVAYTRSLNLGTRDNNAHFRVEMPFVVQPQWTPTQAAASAADAFYQCKAVVLEQAGLAFSIDEGGVLHETIRKAFPDAERKNERRIRAVRDDEDEPEEQARRAHPSNGEFPHPADMDRPKHISEDLWDDLCENYGDGWYDNRAAKAKGDYKATASDFVRASDRKSLWLKPFRGGEGGNRRQPARRGGYDN